MNLPHALWYIVGIYLTPRTHTRLRGSFLDSIFTEEYWRRRGQETTSTVQALAQHTSWSVVYQHYPCLTGEAADVALAWDRLVIYDREENAFRVHDLYPLPPHQMIIQSEKDIYYLDNNQQLHLMLEDRDRIIATEVAYASTFEGKLYILDLEGELSQWDGYEKRILEHSPSTVEGEYVQRVAYTRTNEQVYRVWYHTIEKNCHVAINDTADNISYIAYLYGEEDVESIYQLDDEYVLFAGPPYYITDDRMHKHVPVEISFIKETPFFLVESQLIAWDRYRPMFL